MLHKQEVKTSHLVRPLEKTDSAYLVERVKVKESAGYGEAADKGTKLTFIIGSAVTLLALAGPWLGMVGAISILLMPFVNAAWNVYDGRITKAAARTTRQKAIDKAKTNIKEKKTDQSLDVASANLLLVTNILTFLAAPVLGLGLSPLLGTVFLCLEPFAFAIGTCVALRQAWLSYEKAKRKCDPENLLNDRLEKSVRLKLNISKLESDLEKEGIGSEKHKKITQALYKSKRELERLELQQIALAKKVIHRDGAEADEDKAQKLADLFAEKKYPKITQAKLLEPPTPAEKNLAHYLIEKQKAEASDKLFDAIAWFFATLGMGIGAFAFVFSGSAFVIGCVAMIFLILACGMKAHQLLELGASQKTPLFIMKGMLTEQLYAEYSGLDPRKDPRKKIAGEKSIPKALENKKLSKFDQLRCLIAWELCQHKMRDEQMAIVREEVTEGDISERSGIIAARMKEIDKQLYERFDDAMAAHFFQDILNKTPKQREQYLAQAFDEYAERVVLDCVAESVNKDLLVEKSYAAEQYRRKPHIAEQYRREFIKGLSSGDKERIGKEESKFTAHITAAGFFSKRAQEAKALLEVVRTARTVFTQEKAVNDQDPGLVPPRANAS